LVGSLIDELQRREAAAREETEELRGRTERLAQVEERLSRLVITRETVDEVLGGAGAEASPVAVPDGAVPSRSGHLSAVGVLAVPQWQAGLEISALPEAYRDLLEVAAKGVVMRSGALRAATAKAAARQGRMRTRLVAGEKPNRKRMATLACVYDAEPAPRRPHDVIAPPGGRGSHRKLRPRPKAMAKWLAGSVERDPAPQPKTGRRSKRSQY